MTEDAKALEDGPVLEPTNRLRGLATVGGCVVAVEVMNKSGRDVSGREKSSRFVWAGAVPRCQSSLRSDQSWS